jgi:glyoxylase I family protein
MGAAEPEFSRIMYVGLSVTNVARSAEWYRDVLGFVTERSDANDAWDEVLLRHEASDVLIGLLQHRSNDGTPFSEFRTGLDHLELEVETMSELDRWRTRLDEHGVAHSGAHPHIVTFRDPDNIQLELFCPSGRSAA